MNEKQMENFLNYLKNKNIFRKDIHELTQKHLKDKIILDDKKIEITRLIESNAKLRAETKRQKEKVIERNKVIDLLNKDKPKNEKIMPENILLEK